MTTQNTNSGHIIDKNFCLSSYFAFRYIYKDNYDFYPDLHHRTFDSDTRSNNIRVKTATDIDQAIQKQIDHLYQEHRQIGILLSGGIDSATIASYLKPGSNAYTFTSDVSDIFNPDIERARLYCKKNKLNHHLINISLGDYEKYTPIVMQAKGEPVSAIEPQLYKAALKANDNGDELLLTGNGADSNFGGMDKLISKDWTTAEFIKRFTFLDPTLVLNQPKDMTEIFYKYSRDDGTIDYMSFMENIYDVESDSSYLNAFQTAKMPHYDPFSNLVMAEPLDLKRIRSGDSKYLIRETFAKRYPGFTAPEKIPMPRPVDAIFANWPGPTRPEFRTDIPMDKLTGNQKWQLWCAELFLNLYENKQDN